MTAKRDLVREIADKCRPVLEELACTERLRGTKLMHRGLITYGEIARIVGPQVGLSDLDPYETRLRNELGRLSVETYDERSVLISVLVVNADTLVPGKGFFWLARNHLGAYPDDSSDEEVFIRELKRVRKHYRRRSNSKTPNK